MRIVLDTNTVVSGLLWQGTPRQLFEASRQGLTDFYTCAELLAELTSVLSRRKFISRFSLMVTQVNAEVDRYQSIAQLVSLPQTIPRVSRDPDDDIVLACGIEARADAIVSGDNDLLTLGTYQKIPILRAADVLLLLAGKQQQP